VDGFAGVGSVSIKMASINSSVRVISAESNVEKLAFLLNNATIYEV
jgi:tRNA G37 N-methylase Trm5